MIAGLDYSTGDAVVCMDADLQHPPECLPKIVETLEKGYEVISMVRTRNASAGVLKNVTSAAFYWLINCISDVHFEPNASDFFAVTRPVAEVLKKSYREKVRFLRGYVQNVGFKKTTLEYEAGTRVAGESKYSIKTVYFLCQYHSLLFQYALETGDLRRCAFRGSRTDSADLHLFTRQERPAGMLPLWC